jgi:hypothetical protein
MLQMVLNTVAYHSDDLPEGRVPEILHLTAADLPDAAPLLNHTKVGLLLRISMAWGVLADRMPRRAWGCEELFMCVPSDQNCFAKVGALEQETIRLQRHLDS